MTLTTKEALMKNYVLRSGMRVPAVGFGTYKLTGTTGANAIASAIQTGYRLLDTAYNYENEGAVGAGIRRSGVARSELVVTSKLPGRYYHYNDAITAIQESLFRSGLDYFDLYLLHWPNPKADHYVEAWQALQAAKQFGLVRDIGVCNFLPAHLDRLAQETGELPVVNQIELHPYFNQAAQREYDTAHGILTEDWSPLGRASAVIQDPVLVNLAKRYAVSVGQLILRWEVQLGTLPIPKSAHLTRQRENLALDFTIADQDMAAINALSKPDGRMKQQDPAVYEEF
ncbi:oxidoreductase of aldo keto reductase family [Lacticaseibacillus nasuensis JCM 17158]|uniref:Oxidoreductase of aldo keto reductase family n=2 Tax=Lacticaseibacillus TaxID=2759736 RepID=A0A0R1JUW1_9LACO|nr:oxidoreductase of aldo keto reductase family [Lacticaseibacillus nasuensis JCM 17158]